MVCNIDIVITCFNRSSVIEKAVLSAFSFLSRMDVKGRVIVVDDASTDDSCAVLEKTFSKNITDESLHLLRHETNRGVTAAKNSGFAESYADWVLWLDSDDVLLDSSFDEVVHALSLYTETPLLFLKCINEKGNVVGVMFEKAMSLSLPIYLRHVSYGEALTIANKRMIKHAFFDEDLRGYEGLGCSRIIKKYGPALLLPIVIRQYNQDGSDRLSSPLKFIGRSKLLSEGHKRFLSIFYHDLSWVLRAKLLLKIMIYSLLSLINPILFRVFLAGK